VGGAGELSTRSTAQITTVADLGCDYERERHQIGGTIKDPQLRDKALEALDEKYQERRNPHLQRLRRIEERLSPAPHSR
jgi:hypothetical protein